MSQKLTDIEGIGEKTAEKLRKRLRRSTGKLGSEVTAGEAARSEAVTKSVLAADQQRALAEAEIGFTPERDARQRGVKSSDTDQTQTDTITRGDFRVKKEAVRDARDTFDELPDERQREDKNDREPVVTDIGVWSDNISRFDFPGVDTPSSRSVRAEASDSVLNDPSKDSENAGQLRPRESWRDSQPEPTETQLELGEQPDKADAERTGIYRAGDGEFVERPLRPAGDGQFVSPNGQVVSSLQDPTIGRDPDDGEFEDMPLEREPGVPLPDTGSAGGGMDVSLTSEDRSVLENLARSNMASGDRPEKIEEARLSEDPGPEAREAVVETGESILNFREEIEDPNRTDTDFFTGDDLDRVDSVVSKFRGGR